MKSVTIEFEIKELSIELSNGKGDTFTSTSSKLNEELGDFLSRASEQSAGQGSEGVVLEKLFEHMKSVEYPAWGQEDYIDTVGKCANCGVEFHIHKAVADTPIKGQQPEKERVFMQGDIERLQENVHKITGDGEVMALFNKLLGVSAG